MSEVVFIFLIIAVSIAVPLVIMFVSLRKYGGFGTLFGGLATIKGGMPTSGTIQSITDTGATLTTPSVGPEAPVYKLGLLVTPIAGGEPYQAEATVPIPRVFLPILVPGARIGLAVDPTNPAKVLPDWQRFNNPDSVGEQIEAPAGMAGAQAFGRQGGTMSVGGVDVSFDKSGAPVSGLGNLVGAVRSGSVQTIQGSADQLLATGTHGTAVITTAQPLGKKVRDYNPNADPSRLDDPMWVFTVEVTLPGEAPFPAMFGHRVPVAKVGDIGPGAKLAVAVDPSNPTQDVAIDWNRSPLPA